MLEITQLSLIINQKEILRNISAKCFPGELVCILGRNGTGKSSLLKCISGLYHFEGSIKIFQQPLSKISTKKLAQQIAVVLPNLPAFSKTLNVFETISLGRIPHLNSLQSLNHTDRQIIEQAATITHVKPLLNKKLAQISDGERQRVMIARAIAQNTPIIIADEPTAFLDFYFRKEILQLFKTIAHKEQKIILLSTHEIELALGYADKLLLLNTYKEHLFLHEWQAKQVWEFLFQ